MEIIPHQYIEMKEEKRTADDNFSIQAYRDESGKYQQTAFITHQYMEMKEENMTAYGSYST